MALSPRGFSRLALANFVALVAIIATGAAVRLTGSGLGCADWPNCTQHRFIAALGQTHAVIEDSNRAVTAVLIVLTGITLVASLLRSPRRSDLTWLSASLIGGIVADALLGAIVVYTKLNPWLVSGHMALSLAMVVVAGVLYHRSKYSYALGSRRDVRCEWGRTLARWLWVALGVTLVTGMATTGSGPHSGASMGQVAAKRLPFSLQDAAWVHSAAAALFVGTVAGAYLVLARTGAASRVVNGAKRLLAVGAAQGVLGIVQYATRLPVVLVELHVITAVSITIGVLQFQLCLVARDREPGLEPAAAPTRDAPLVVA